MHKFITFKNTPVHFTDNGKGKAIVLLHGFLGAAEIWVPFTRVLSKEYRIVTIDLPGHGLTGNISAVHSMELMAETVKAVLDNLRIKKCCLIGHSMGGSVTLAFAELFPAMLTGFGLFHSTSYDDSPEVKLNRDKMVEAVKSNHIQFVCSFIPNLFAPENAEKCGIQIKHLQDLASGMSKEAIIASLVGMKERKNRVDILAGSKVPVLFIIGKKDTRQPFDRVMPQLAVCENATVKILGSVAHMGFIEDVKSCIHTVKAFAAGL